MPERNGAHRRAGTKQIGGIPTILGEGHWRADLEGLLTVVDSPLQVVGLLPSYALTVGVRQVVLGSAQSAGKA